jgi:hypothetical protein
MIVKIIFEVFKKKLPGQNIVSAMNLLTSI